MRTPRRQRSSFLHLRWMTCWTLSILLLISTPNTIAIASESTNNATNNELELTLPHWETCAAHNSCNDCYTASHTCHWCEHDQACHVKGSVHTGCVKGATCPGTPPPEVAQSCSNHISCTECSSSSWGCHWCKSDEACHAVGSKYGCATGASCYAIERCQRLEPERMDGGGTFSKASFQGVGPVAKGVLGVLLGLVLCCSTLCFAGATFMKCAVDDLMGQPVEIVEDGMLISGGRYERVQSIEEEPEEGRSELEFPLMQNGTTTAAAAASGEQEVEEGSDEKDVEDNHSPDGFSNNDPVLMRSEAASVARSRSRMPRVSQSSARAAPRGSSIKRMYCGCQLCYLFTLLGCILLYIVGLSYSPRAPQYNVCTNELAWKSIVEGMASLEMSASFDLLISVYNPNRFEVDLTNGHGNFHHNDQYVGSFDMPSASISERAISDIVVKVTFTPDKWSALSLTSEYYRGMLKFVLGGKAHVKIPGLGNYQFDAKFDDIHINVNDPSLDDTHLCACPGWKKPLSPSTKPAPKPAWVIEG